MCGAILWWNIEIWYTLKYDEMLHLIEVILGTLIFHKWLELLVLIKAKPNVVWVGLRWISSSKTVKTQQLAIIDQSTIGFKHSRDPKSQISVHVLQDWAWQKSLLLIKAALMWSNIEYNNVKYFYNFK